MKAYVDGGYVNDGTENNSGYCSFSVYSKDWKFLSSRIPLPAAKTNNEAEYLAIIELLDYLVKNNYTREPLTIYSDSKVLVNQVKGRWLINAKNLQNLYLKVHSLMSHFHEVVDLEWTPRENIVKELGH